MPPIAVFEGSDQHAAGLIHCHRSSGKRDGSYRQVLTHGFVVDEQDGNVQANVVDPLKMINELGADILSLWIACRLSTDVSVSENIIRQR